MARPGGAVEGSFGSQLRAHREQAGLSQEALAAQSGVSVETISQWERGLVRRPRRSTLKLLADALRLEPAAVEAMWAAAQSRAEPRAEPAPKQRPRTALPKRLLAVTFAVATLVASGGTWAVVSRFRVDPPSRARSPFLPVVDRPGESGVWSAYVGPGCGSPGAATLSERSPGGSADGWHPTSGGAADFSCAAAVSSRGSGDAVRAQDDAEWLFSPGQPASCAFAVYIPEGSAAPRAHYSVYSGNVGAGYSGPALIRFTIDQRAAAGNWVGIGPYVSPTGVIELVLDDSGASGAQSVVADVVLATCTGS
jgi:transcriptional regulator with XRE-family HTH domain